MGQDRMCGGAGQQAWWGRKYGGSGKEVWWGGMPGLEGQGRGCYVMGQITVGQDRAGETRTNKLQG